MTATRPKTVLQKIPENMNVEKIAVVRANAMGDFLFSLPALEAVKRRYPDAELVYLGTGWHRAFISGRPGPVDRVIAIPKCRGMPHETDRVQSEAEVAAFFEAMRDERFDVALQIHGGGGNSNPFTAKLGAALSVGLQADGAPPLDINVPYYLYQHEVLRYLEVAARIDARTEDIEPRVNVTDADVNALPEHIRGPGEQPYAVLHPGASELRRQWPPEKFARTGDMLVRRGLKVYISGTAPEKTIAEKAARLMKSPAENLSGRLSLNALVALLAGARIVISNDTGPLHLARATGTPAVGIYWIGNAMTANVLSATKNRNAISWRNHCPLCGVDCFKVDVHHATGGCDHLASFVDDVPFEEVAGHVNSLLASREAVTV